MIIKKFKTRQNCSLVITCSQHFNRVHHKPDSTVNCMIKGSLINDPYIQGISGLDCWIAQSRLKSNLVDSIVLDNPKSKSYFRFGLSIQFCHFNPNPKYHNHFIKKLKFHSTSCSNIEAKLLFIKIFEQLIYQ